MIIKPNDTSPLSTTFDKADPIKPAEPVTKPSELLVQI